MATLYISEYNGTGFVQSNNGPFSVQAQAPKEPRLAAQTVAISGSSTQSSAFQNNPGINAGQTYLIRVHTDSICSIAIGASPLAVTTEGRMAANQTEYFTVSPGQKIAVILNV